MAIAGLVLAGAAGIASLVFALQLLVRAFKTGTAWGLVSLFVPLGVFVFALKHWDAARRPFLRALACIPAWVGGVALMMIGGGGTWTITSVAAEPEPPASAAIVETPNLVLETLTATESIAGTGHEGVPACDDGSIGRTLIAPDQISMCGRQTNVFGETRTDWIQEVKSDSYFGDPLGGQWVSWLRIKRKGTGEHVAFVVFGVLSSRDGRLSVECDAGGAARIQSSRAQPRRGLEPACGEVSSAHGHGRFLFNWDAKAPRLRFEATEGPVIDVNLVKVG
jgi:hypothetical protein